VKRLFQEDLPLLEKLEILKKSTEFQVSAPKARHSISSINKQKKKAFYTHKCSEIS